jgi:hypothetical protein
VRSTFSLDFQSKYHGAPPPRREAVAPGCASWPAFLLGIVLPMVFFDLNIESQKSCGSTINPWLSAIELAGKAE